MEGGTCRRVAAGRYYFHRFCHRQRSAVWRAVADGDAVSATVDLRFTFGNEHVRTVVRNFFPVFLSRGVVQISAYVDSFLASFLPVGAVSALAYAQTLNTLPVSLSGMAISAAELPAMSSASGTQEEIGAVLRRRLELGLQNIAFFVVPSAVAFLVLGDVVVATIYRGGHFTAHDVKFVWSVLAGSAVGLLASTSEKLYSSRSMRCGIHERRWTLQLFAWC